MRPHCLAATILILVASCINEEKTADDPKSNPSIPAVAQLSNIVKEVKVRKARDIVWTQGIDPQPLANNDAVRTGEQSMVDLIYNDATKIKVSPKTMVIVVDRNTEAKIEKSVLGLSSGAVKGTLDSMSDQAVELVIRTNRGWITATNQKGQKKTSFKARITKNGSLKIKSDQGNVKWVTKKKTMVIQEKEIMTMTASTSPETLSDTQSKFQELPDINLDKEKIVIKPASKSDDVYFDNPDLPDLTPSAAPKAKPTNRNPEFKLLTPKNKETVSGKSVTVKGVLIGSLQVFLNGQPIKATNGKFSTVYQLVPGSNILTFQIVDPITNKVKYESIEVRRK